jgi:ribosomal protein L37AE/L43A
MTLKQQHLAAKRQARIAAQERIARSIEAARLTVATGVCPECGQPLRYNNAMAGWWQCSGYGAEGFRAPGSTPCSFQTFTE